MGNRRNVITLNGNRYDAVTGQLLDDSPKKLISKPTGQSRVEGFVSKPTPKKSATNRNPHNISRPTHKSKTLMRKVVSKPSVKQTESRTITKPSVQKTVSANPSRELRAKSTSKSSLVSKFGLTSSNNTTKYSSLPLVKPPKHGSINNSTEHTTKAVLNNQNTALPSKNNKLAENALKNAQSHSSTKAKKVKRTHKLAKKLKVKPSFLNISLFILAGMFLTGYFAYNNVPNLAMKVASTRSGMNGSVPDYQASGFSFKGPIQYKTGEIKLTYKSNSDSRSYEVIERNSEWNSDALLANHVATNGRTYQILQEQGKTIYIYDGDNASWTENGVWYEVKGGEALSANQVIKIANSL